MTQEKKQLLLKDICGRIPYDLWVDFVGNKFLLTGYGHGRVSLLTSAFSSAVGPCPSIEQVKPYLRPLSSITTEEWIEYCDCCSEDEKDEIISEQTGYRITPTTHREHFFNSHHFDYRGLIPMGLALEAPGGMYEV